MGDTMTHVGTSTRSVVSSNPARPRQRLSLSGVVRSELIKARSVRSSLYLCVGMMLAITGLGAASAIGSAAGNPSPDAVTDPLGGSLAGVGFAQLLAGAFGVLVVTSEYATGTARTTLITIPRRGLVVAAKCIMTAGVVTIASAIALGTCFALSYVVADSVLSITADGVVRALVGAVAYLSITAVLGSAFGWLTRSTIGAFTLLLSLTYLPVILFAAAPDWRTVSWLAPANSGSALMQIGPSDLPHPTVGLAILLAYVAGLTALATTRLQHADA